LKSWNWDRSPLVCGSHNFCQIAEYAAQKITAKMAKTLGLDQNDENQSKNSRKEPKNNVVRSK
jgi:hypothetical protein